MKNGPVEIVCGIDENYAPHLGVLLASIAKTNKGGSIRAHIIHDGVSEASRNRVAASARSIELTWYEIVDHQALGFKPLLQITRATYLRLTMAEVLPPDLARVLYLDVDMVVNDWLRPLWEIDLGQHLCAAVADPGVDIEAFRALHMLPDTKAELGYFNAGVILFDLEKVREQGLLSAAVDLLARPGAKYEWADQDVLNIIFWNKWLSIDPAWNFQRKFLYDDFAAWHKLVPAKSKAPKIVHFTEQEKPWKKSEWHPLAWLYLMHLQQTPFVAEVLERGGFDLRTRLKWRLRASLMKPKIFC